MRQLRVLPLHPKVKVMGQLGLAPTALVPACQTAREVALVPSLPFPRPPSCAGRPAFGPGVASDGKPVPVPRRPTTCFFCFSAVVDVAF